MSKVKNFVPMNPPTPSLPGGRSGGAGQGDSGMPKVVDGVPADVTSGDLVDAGVPPRNPAVVGTGPLEASRQLLGSGPWPDKITTIPSGKPPLDEARDCLYRMRFHLSLFAKDLGSVLLGPLAGEIRTAAAAKKCQIGGDQNQWRPLNELIAVLDMLKPVKLD